MIISYPDSRPYCFRLTSSLPSLVATILLSLPSSLCEGSRAVSEDENRTSQSNLIPLCIHQYHFRKYSYPLDSADLHISRLEKHWLPSWPDLRRQWNVSSSDTTNMPLNDIKTENLIIRCEPLTNLDRLGRRSFSENGRCGPNYGGLVCDPESPIYTGTCCSKFGWW